VTDPTIDIPAAPHLRVISTGATAEDIAAATAVVTGALEELADAMAVESGPTVSAWQRSQRPMRGTVPHGAGTWRSFSG